MGNVFVMDTSLDTTLNPGFAAAGKGYSIQGV